MQQFIKDYQFLIFMAVQIGWAGFAWWYRKNVATKDDVARVQKNVEGVGSRVSAIEITMEGAPSRDDISNLHLEMEKTRGHIGAFTAELRGAQATMQAQTEGVSRLLTRAESMLTMLIENALADGRSNR